MYKNNDIELPMVQLISFNKLLERYEAMAYSDDSGQADKAKRILEAQVPYPELREGFADSSLLEKHKEVIHTILQDVFPEVLTKNEIKTASLPYNDVIFNSSERFNRILEDAGGEEFIPEKRELPPDEMYVMACTVILNFYYGFHLDFRRPFFYDIPDANGVMRHYRILYNADFMEIIPTEASKELTQVDVDELLDNFDDIELWKEKIPPNSFVTKGFVVCNMFDVTAEHSISEIKSSLISNDKQGDSSFVDELQDTFRSFFKVPDIEAGFVVYDANQDHFERVYGKGVKSFILSEKNVDDCKKVLCEDSYQKILCESDYFSIADVDRNYEISGGMAPYENLKKKGFKSAIFAPIADNGKVLGVLELASKKVNALNSVNAIKLVDVMPFIVSAVLRSMAEEENLIDAVIQHECTSVHESVYWRFQEEAKRFIKESIDGQQPTFKEIIFKDVHPLYGQVDIKDSSAARNLAIQRDLMIQLSTIKEILIAAVKKNCLPIYEELIFRVDNLTNSIKENLHTNSEQAIFTFVRDEVNPVFGHLKKTDPELAQMISAYEASIDMGTDSYYDHRRNYDESVLRINQELAVMIDKKQEEAQAMFPHYFERYKTDGVEHNIYVGDSIVDKLDFNPIYLSNLRLWQLQVMCEMENAHYKLRPKLPVPLDVASLILVYNTSLSIRFRMDEKRFDVDGTYNARYEVIKKRIDKSYIKGSNQRLTQPGKMVIVYSQKKDELEYLRYIKFLRSKGYFTGKIEIVELEGLQGVSGLKAIRADIFYKTEQSEERTFSYNDLMEELKA